MREVKDAFVAPLTSRPLSPGLSPPFSNLCTLDRFQASTAPSILWLNDEADGWDLNLTEMMKLHVSGLAIGAAACSQETRCTGAGWRFFSDQSGAPSDTGVIGKSLLLHYVHRAIVCPKSLISFRLSLVNILTLRLWTPRGCTFTGVGGIFAREHLLVSQGRAVNPEASGNGMEPSDSDGFNEWRRW